MNNENQTNQNGNNPGLESTTLGAAPVMPEVPNDSTNVVPNTPNNTVVNEANMNSPVDNPSTINPAAQTTSNANTLGEVNNLNAPSDSVNLGNISDTNAATNPTPVAPVNDPNLANNLDPIAQPIPGTNNAFGNGNNVNSNGFVESQKVQSVGTEVPNQPENNKPKKGMNKVLFIILILALLAAIAYGVYYYLSLSKKSSQPQIAVRTSTLEVELNSALSTNIADYATITGTDAKNCSLNTSNVDISVEGTYEYNIICGNDTYKGNVIVVNNALPTATTKDVYATLVTDEATAGSTNVMDFIVDGSCTSTDCTYAFGDGFDLTNSLKTAGVYEVPIVITDSTNKTNNLTGTLIVLAKPVKLFLNCSTTVDNSTVTDRIAVGDDNTFFGYAERVSVFTFDDEEEYKNATNGKNSNISYNNVSGRATYDDNNKTLTIKSELTTEILNSEAGGTFPTTFAEIRTYYENVDKGYSCTFER